MKTRHVIVALGLALVFAAQPAHAQTKLDSAQIINSLQGIEAIVPPNIAAIRQQALANIAAKRGEDPRTRQPVAAALNKLPQFTVEILFDFDSAAIRPESFRTVGLLADALHHPFLLGYKILVVGHTDAKGDRKYNLELSQKRADAIRDALVTTFRVAPNRVVALGLGEEQLRDPAHPDSGVNRRVQLINIGRMGPPARPVR